MDFLKHNKRLIGIAILILVIAFYVVSSGSSSGGDTLTTSDNGPATTELLASLSSLHTIQLDDSVFSDPAFQSLTDFGVVIPPQEVGRRNPFLPAGVGGSTGSSTVKK